MGADPAALRSLPLFAGLTDAELATMAAHVEVRRVDPGEHLTHEGASGYFFFVIEDGTAAVERDGGIDAIFSWGTCAVRDARPAAPA